MDFRKNIESHSLLYILDNGGYEPGYTTPKDQEIETVLNDIDKLILRMRDDIHKVGMLACDFWIDARTMDEKTDWLLLVY